MKSNNDPILDARDICQLRPDPVPHEKLVETLRQLGWHEQVAIEAIGAAAQAGFIKSAQGGYTT